MTSQENPFTLEQRLDKVKLAVRKATEEALLSKEDVIALQQENKSPNASFALGMTLFGQEVKQLEQQIQDKLDLVEQELENINVQIATTTPPQQQHQQSPEALQMEANDIKTRITFLRHVSHARMALDEASSSSSSNVQAAILVVQAHTSWTNAQTIVHEEEQRSQTLSPALQGAHRILDSIQAIIRRQRIHLRHKAKQIMGTTLELTPSTISVRGGSEAFDILQELSESHECLEQTIHTMADQLLANIFLPVLNRMDQGTQFIIYFQAREESKKLTNTNKGTKYILDWTIEPPTNTISSEETTVQQWKEIFDFFSGVLGFVHTHIFLQRQPMCRMMGRRLFGKHGPVINDLDLNALGLESYLLDESGRLMKPLLKLLCKTCVPVYIEPTAFGDLQDKGKYLRSVLLPFDEELVRYSFAESETLLNDFSNQFEQKYIEKRRSTLLNEARNILVHNDYHNTSLVGDDVRTNDDDSILPKSNNAMAIFKLHRSAVSDTSQQIMELVRRTMDEAVAPHGQSLLAASLYRTSRDMLDLFRIIIPSTHAHEVNSVPRTAAILHNDSVFFAHHCLTLGIEYKELFPDGSDTRGQLLKQGCIFVDMVPPFRELADKAMGDMVESQRDQLWELVALRVKLLGKSLSSNELLMEWTDAETAMKAGLHHLNHLSQAWKSVLSHDVFSTSIGFLADTVFGIFLDQILSANDISESACHFLSSLTATAMQSVLRIVPTTKSWDRFSAVGRFMDMSLGDVHVALSNGVFASVTGPELSKLIRATFGDSDKRRMLLKSLSAEH